MAFSKKLNDPRGLDRTFGNGQPDDEQSNRGASGPSKRIGTIDGRLTRYKKGHGAGTSTMGNTKGLNRGFGNAVPYEEGGSSLPSRGKNDG